jgi:hypothetical protein
MPSAASFSPGFQMIARAITDTAITPPLQPPTFSPAERQLAITTFRAITPAIEII